MTYWWLSLRTRHAVRHMSKLPGVLSRKLRNLGANCRTASARIGGRSAFLSAKCDRIGGSHPICGTFLSARTSMRGLMIASKSPASDEKHKVILFRFPIIRFENSTSALPTIRHFRYSTRPTWRFWRGARDFKQNEKTRALSPRSIHAQHPMTVPVRR